ncbi:MAG: Lrp/AsnC family transcriptional regulator [Lentisphaeria bacterium]|jgi:DNA-binding Lrp family transcriptional regulator|nr:Lrp/AsnC family transcriptional regulator [Lentisphaeria bacterium]MDD6338152.1 Lrp/AsnC family transcriptional regulator [Lentisphaeria bacterium]
MNLEERKLILSALAKDAKTTAADLAEQLGATEQEVAAEIAELENRNIIRGYHAIINEDNLHDKPVKAIIQVRVRPEREGGFDRIARRLSKFPQVTALYLMSGGYDLMLEVRGADLNEVADFVSSKLATIDGVLSTGTHFLLKKYKESGTLLLEEEHDERLKIVP